MKETKLYGLYDRVASSFLSSFPTDNIEVLKRDYSHIINEIGSKNPIRLNCDDLDLFELGSFDIETGEIVPNKKFCFRLSELKKDEVHLQ